MSFYTYANEDDYAREFDCYMNDEEKEYWAEQDRIAGEEEAFWEGLNG